jgi:hypothetical protein
MTLLLLNFQPPAPGTGSARWLAIVNAVRQAVGSTTEPEARGWALDAARRLNARAEFLIAFGEIGTTVAGQSDYEIGPLVVELQTVSVSGTKYTRVTTGELADLRTGDARVIDGPGKVFAPTWDLTGDAGVSVWPTPTATGQSITGRAVIRVPTPEDWATDDPLLPEDFDDAIIHGAIAIGLARKDERLDDAQWHEDRFLAAIPELRRRQHSRQGRGPVRIRVMGRDR